MFSQVEYEIGLCFWLLLFSLGTGEGNITFLSLISVDDFPGDIWNNSAGFWLIIISNQTVIWRGKFGPNLVNIVKTSQLEIKLVFVTVKINARQKDVLRLTGISLVSWSASRPFRFTPGTHSRGRYPKLRGPFEEFVAWRQCAAVMQREAVTVMPSCSGGGNVVVAWSSSI
jgi:hypothetical protein